jgi:hypothetical protein
LKTGLSPIKKVRPEERFKAAIISEALQKNGGAISAARDGATNGERQGHRYPIGV